MCVRLCVRVCVSNSRWRFMVVYGCCVLVYGGVWLCMVVFFTLTVKRKDVQSVKFYLPPLTFLQTHTHTHTYAYIRKHMHTQKMYLLLCIMCVYVRVCVCCVCVCRRFVQR